MSLTRSFRRRSLLGLSVAVGAALVATACTTTMPGRAVSVFDDPFKVAGMPATDGPTGLRPNAEAPARHVEGTDGGAIDELGASAISDIEDYWATAYPETFDERFKPVAELISWDANGFDGEFCGDSTYGLVNAGFCYADRTIGWDRGELLPALQRAHGDIGVLMVLAHEYGHAISRLGGLTGKDTPTLVAEQQADCFSGSYMRWVAEDSSQRFSLSTGEGLNNVLAGVISVRDPLLNEGDPDVGFDEHGSAFERLSAFQFGFTDGPSACAGIDLEEIAQRRGDLPVLLPEDQTGELPVSEESVRSMIEAMEVLFEPENPPALSFEPGDADSCADARPSPPASYCPATNTIVVDLDGLEDLSAPTDPDDAGSLAVGDNAAYSVLVSRYMLAIQQERGGLALDNAAAALRTACLTGVATAKLTKEIQTPDGDTIALTAGDVDEAVSGILMNGLAASDVNGDSVPSGFSRIDAFRLGVLGDTPRCFKRFP
ncbi:peptidase [Mycolicibacterium parafortuitum]|uniref:Putative lipoprotein peptidase LpqM [Mycobacterium tuberculosis H37Rv] n=1 Tax=Mycolicibacterium parafortuitum TaxID=39692 RepID=A0A375YQE2_MYCPF|nr:peptidase [Mycolicibacterium parafortuitum]ORB28234.1 peptidase [Mycolicibacterium parafortuitum]SRX83303.1 putative lipoprotein peptidase LpqM [Mycobacterium tuberculosis H37Rv] [Mycolicibacterium parafortuitum]